MITDITSEPFSSFIGDFTPIVLLVFFAALILIVLGLMDTNKTPGDDYKELGDRIKLAYEAKFGYKNPEFDKEVDLRVIQCQRLKGWTFKIALNHLQRMAKMTECK